MTPLTRPMIDHHKHCDECFAAAEAAVLESRWEEGRTLFDAFRNELESHFCMEEERLFPAFEQATGMAGGPTQVMRHEHAQMRDLVKQMDTALLAQDKAGFSGAAETLLILMQQHNMKEENILYPMCNQSLEGQSLELEAVFVAGR